MVRHGRVLLRSFRTCSPRTFCRLRNIVLLIVLSVIVTVTVTVAKWFFPPYRLAFSLGSVLLSVRNVSFSNDTSSVLNISASSVSLHNSSNLTPSPGSSTVGLVSGGYLAHKTPMTGVGQGNLMFMYASLLGIADHKKMTPVYQEDGFLRTVFQISARSLIPNAASVISEAKACSFDSNLVSMSNRNSNLTIFGYVQSWKYFSAIDDKIRREFTLNDTLRSEAQKFLGTSRMNSAAKGAKETLFIGVHIRRRDMVANYNIVRGYTVAPKEYLDTAVNYFRTNFPAKMLIYVVCSDDPVWSKDNFRSTKDNSSFVVFSENRTAVQDMALLVACNHSILTVGTFGWWSGYLAGGRTVYYKNFPAPGTHIDSIFRKEDYFPPAWIGL